MSLFPWLLGFLGASLRPLRTSAGFDQSEFTSILNQPIIGLHIVVSIIPTPIQVSKNFCLNHTNVCNKRLQFSYPIKILLFCYRIDKRYRITYECLIMTWKRQDLSKIFFGHPELTWTVCWSFHADFRVTFKLCTSNQLPFLWNCFFWLSEENNPSLCLKNNIIITY